MRVPEFETERLILRGVSLQDIPAYEKHFIDYEVVRHLAAHVPWPYPRGGVREFLESHIFPNLGEGVWFWGIYLKNEPQELIGVVQLWSEGNPENRGFWLGKKFWGQGIMTEAVQPVMDYAFNELGFEKLTFANAVQNKRSRRIKEKTGARFIETRPAQFVDPELKEHEIWELKKDEWIRFRSSES